MLFRSGAYPCDDDGDGWIRESARAALTSDDPQVLDNARCDLRVVDRFVLENRTVNWFDPSTDCVGDAACSQHAVVWLEDPLELYETDRNDDQGLLELDKDVELWIETSTRTPIFVETGVPFGIVRPTISATLVNWDAVPGFEPRILSTRDITDGS